jgi:hypothetical protein
MIRRVRRHAPPIARDAFAFRCDSYVAQLVALRAGRDRVQLLFDFLADRLGAFVKREGPARRGAPSGCTEAAIRGASRLTKGPVRRDGSNYNGPRRSARCVDDRR